MTPMEQEHYGGKNDKRTKNNPSPSHYMLNPMLLLLKLILWHKYKQERKAEKGHSPIDQAPLIIKQKINNQWRDNKT